MRFLAIWKGEMRKMLDKIKDKKWIKTALWGISCILLTVYFFTNRDFYIKEVKLDDETLETIEITKVVLFIIVVTSLFALRFVKNNLSDRHNALFAKGWFLLLPIINYRMLEYLNEEQFRITFTKIYKPYHVMNIILFFVFLYLFYVITANIKISGVLLVICNAIFGIANYYVYSFRNLAIVASDIYSVKTAASVAGNYEFFMDYYILFTIVASVLLCTITLKFRKIDKISWKRRVIYSLPFIPVAAGVIWFTVYSTFLTDIGMKVRLYKPQNEYKRYGTLLTTLRTTSYILVEKPESYSDEDVIAEEELYIKNDTGQTVENGANPNIIVIMDEAFSDLTAINDEFVLEEDNMPFIRGLTENTIKGNAYVSVYGGNTANTEFEFLTGNTMAFMPTNSVPYQLFIKNEMSNLTATLKAMGYGGNIALHPYYAEGFSRDRIYPIFGFERFITNSDFKGAQKLRSYITDEEDFMRIIEEYEKERIISESPFYLFNVTMQNHGGYRVNDEALDETRIKVANETYEERSIKQYINLVKYTDDADRKSVV